MLFPVQACLFSYSPLRMKIRIFLHRSLVIPDKLNKSDLNFAHCILFVIYQRIEIQALVIRARQLNKVPALLAVVGNGGREHIGVGDLLQQRHLRQTVDAVDLAAARGTRRRGRSPAGCQDRCGPRIRGLPADATCSW